MKINYLPLFLFSAIYYPGGCDVAVGAHYCNPCEPIEHGRVRSVAYVKKDFAFTDPTDATEWEAGVAAGDIIIIAEVIGSSNGGAPVEAPGYGDQSTKITGYDFEVVYKDPNFAQNADFYNAMKYSRNFKIAYRTENFTQISTNAVSVVPSAPITENLSDEVVWNVTVKFTQGDIPTPIATPAGIFTCFAYSA